MSTIAQKSHFVLVLNFTGQRLDANHVVILWKDKRFGLKLMVDCSHYGQGMATASFKKEST